VFCLEDSSLKSKTIGQRVGRQAYLRVCSKLRINPISSVSRGLFTDELVVSERRLTSHDTLAICNALQVTYVLLLLLLLLF